MDARRSSCSRTAAARSARSARADRGGGGPFAPRDATLAAELARLDERRRAVGDEAARLEVEQTRLQEMDEQLERDLCDGQSALDDARAAHSRLEVERGGLADVEAAAHLRCEQAATTEAASSRTLETAEAGLRQALARQADLAARATHLKEGLARSAKGREDVAAVQQRTSRSLLFSPHQHRPKQTPRMRRWNRRCARRRRLCRLPKRLSTRPGRRRDATRDALEQAAAQRGEYLERLRARRSSRHARRPNDGRLWSRVRQEMESRRARVSGRMRELREALDEQRGSVASSNSRRGRPPSSTRSVVSARPKRSF